ncbi:hypothetical protein DL93DRAFT_2194203 [Clavulina sp. PMI_390]|nr:hypothetical protein DL93DRAFT_2194203 [Clavulina sp. PMI_390]
MLSQFSFLALARFLWYAVTYRVPSPCGKQPRRSRGRIGPILSITAFCSCLLFSLSIGIKIVDVILHDQLRTALALKGHPESVDAMAIVAPSYDVWAREALSGGNVLPLEDLPVARAGGQNVSDVFATYPTPPMGNMSIAFLGPRTTDVAVTASSIALGTSCSIRRPQCRSSWSPNADYGRLVTSCEGIDDPFGIVYNTTLMQNQPQIFLSPNISDSPHGSVTSPFQHNGFLCFEAYSHFPHQEDITSDPEEVPFISWNTISSGRYFAANELPVTLCFTYLCKSKVFRAVYSIAEGIITLDKTSLAPIQNLSTNIAVSRTLTSYTAGMGAWDYADENHYVDAQLKNDVDSIGNLYGNDTEQFRLALSQAFSNRLLGWSAGAIILSETRGTRFEEILTLHIPLTPAGIFITLHLVYSSVVLILGGRALLFPKRYCTTESLDLLRLESAGESLTSSTSAGSPNSSHTNTQYNGNTFSHSLLYGRHQADEVTTSSDLLIAQHRLTDASTLLSEILLKEDGLEHHEPREPLAEGNMSQIESVYQSREAFSRRDRPPSINAAYDHLVLAPRIRLRFISVGPVSKPVNKRSTLVRSTLQLQAGGV